MFVAAAYGNVCTVSNEGGRPVSGTPNLPTKKLPTEIA